MFITGETILHAYQEGKALCKFVDNDTWFCKNPYQKGTKLWESWTQGWNSYYNPEWEKKEAA